MAYADSNPRTILEGFLPSPPVVMAVDVKAGDAITYNGGWTLAGAATATRVFVASEDAKAGEKIRLYAGAVVRGFTDAAPGTAMALAANGKYDQTGAQKCGLAMTADTAYIGPDLAPTAA